MYFDDIHILQTVVILYHKQGNAQKGKGKKERYSMNNNFTAYVAMTEATALGARDRVLDDLNALTNGEAEKAIKYVAEFNELDSICKKIANEKEEKAS